MLTLLQYPIIDVKHDKWLHVIHVYKREIKLISTDLLDFTPTFYNRKFSKKQNILSNKIRELTDKINHLELMMHVYVNDIEQLVDNPSPDLRKKTETAYDLIKIGLIESTDAFIEIERDFADFVA